MSIGITINGQRQVVESETLPYEKIVRYAYPEVPPQAPWLDYVTVVYSRAGGSKPEGSLLKGQSVTVQEGTVINAVDTGNA